MTDDLAKQVADMMIAFVDASPDADLVAKVRQDAEAEREQIIAAANIAANLIVANATADAAAKKAVIEQDIATLTVMRDQLIAEVAANSKPVIAAQAAAAAVTATPSTP